MPLGIVLTEWDAAIGTIIKGSFPAQNPLSMGEINKILMSHSISKVKEPEILELRIQNKIILSYCAKEKIASLGYSMILLVFQEDEDKQIKKYKEDLYNHGNFLFNLGKSERLSYFKKLTFDLFSKKSSRKLLFVGTSAVGKTSIKKTFFECISSEELLNKPLEPTYGLVHYNYDYFDLDLGIADLAGQEIEHFLKQSIDSEIDPFEETDVILYVFDPSFWESSKDHILDHLEEIRSILHKKQIPAEIFVFCNKIDLIPNNERDIFQSTIYKELNQFSQDHIFFTSIQEQFLPQLFRAMQIVLSHFSTRTNAMEELIFQILEDHHSTAILILHENKILLEISTKDFPSFQFSNLISFLEITTDLSRKFQEKVSSILMQVGKLNLYFNELDEYSTDKILILSTTLDSKKLAKLHQTIHFSLDYVKEFSLDER